MKKDNKIIIGIVCVLLFMFLLSVLYLSLNFNFRFGTSLAVMQDDFFNRYSSGGAFTKYEIKSMKNDVWVMFAYDLAPNNLVVRQYCLIDLMGNSSKHKAIILNEVRRIGKDCIWLEGYSYWLYTKPFLNSYALIFNDTNISSFIDCVDSGFVKTAYIRDGKLYPAPFGDLRNVSLETNLQTGRVVYNITLGPITKEGEDYFIKKSPLGLNAHAMKIDSNIYIINGTPYYNKDGKKEFSWYNGYDLKYKNKFEELWDYIDRLRFLFK